MLGQPTTSAWTRVRLFLTKSLQIEDVSKFNLQQNKENPKEIKIFLTECRRKNKIKQKGKKKEEEEKTAKYVKIF